ncbi:formyltransferase family protein [Natrarchaeobaculum sulfurireducens]|uniref:Folate-dependent phosphoribosylglycinamide formyltransferase PurN n=1 Tax=Natrarchaeobaculum sulfurireducens TaxID=2044521 RepID=A0A346PHP4_9EURY|nr:formyltransferase family protein [Natrarchaeobaculum sulfurireducens]AXR79039.1 Folate-dependent phosphoribosylglycinamide formyltransferase PurN [Natrarchaeobaculum sulfurireducens]
MDGDGPLTVGILTEPFLYEWQVRAIERVRATPGVEIPLVVHNASNGEYDAESWNEKKRLGLEDLTQFLEVFRTERAWTFVLAARTIARLLGDEQTLWHRHSVENVDALADAEHVRCTPQTDGNWNELPDDAVVTLAARCDVVVRFGFGLVRGSVLTAPEHGVLSFHPADIREYRGMGPPVIFHDGRERAGATLQRLNESIDGGEIVAYDEVSLEGCATLWDVFDRLATLQIRLLVEGLENLRDPTFEPRTVPENQLGEFYPRARRRTLAFSGRVLAKNVSGRLRRRLRRIRSPVTHDSTPRPP